MTRLGATAVDLDEIMAARAKMRAKDGTAAEPTASSQLDLEEASLGHLILLWLGLTALIVVKAIADFLALVGRLMAGQPRPKQRPKRR